MRKIGLFFISLFWAQILHAQTAGLGSWNIFNTKFTYTNQWSFFAEGQVRSLDFYNQFNYHELKGGVHYSFSPSILLTVGTGSYQTYQTTGNFKLPKSNNEFRIWPQLILLHSIEAINIEQRFQIGRAHV